MNMFEQLVLQVLLLAQDAPDVAQEPGLSDYLSVYGPPILFMFALYMVLVMMPQNRERKGRESFLNNLKKNDQVVTVGGIFGTISGFSADGSQVTLRVDDNSRIRVRRGSIEGVVKSEGDDKKAEA
ncbi:preprotein translocase subunit YajC [Rubinisphaera margarita]|uniref:preprotein translocase subunit YajC n=1 Tax=Rubinisphaera margarita TaxID=2909586 RepID=UPI001EE935DD|nr:preprotein translocase subunit YajC [Rubinisphaera margarita]MCG6155431.1 preprotein translocase subunit YajC [Rubinisphaera margarita]